MEVAFGGNLTLDTEVIALHGVIASYSSDAEAEPKLPFWPLLFKDTTIRLIGSDDLPGEANRQAVADITTCLETGVLRPRASPRACRSYASQRHTRRSRAASPAVGSYWTYK